MATPEAALAPGAIPTEKRALISEKRVYPAHYKRRKVHFTPHSRPTVRQVYRIIGYEAKRWGISAGHLAGRVSCESGMRWWAGNGQYHGLGQFAYSTFTRGLSTMPRAVKVKRSRILQRPTFHIAHYSDGSVKRRKSFKVKVRRTRIYVGWIRHPDWLHGWAQLRIMAQAMANRSAVHDSEWECR